MRARLKKALNYLYLRPELVFVMIALPFGLFSAIAVPQISITDENSHFLRAYQVSRGELVCDKKTIYPQEIIDKSRSSSDGSRNYTMDFADRVGDEGEKQYTCGSAAEYAPVAYGPQAIGVALAETVSSSAALMVLLARIINLLVYIVAVYLIIKKVLVGKYVFFVITLIPQMIHLAASLSADMMNNVVALGLVALTINLFIQRQKISKKQVGLLIGLIALVALLKTNLLILLLPLVFLPSRIFKDNVSKSVPFNIQKWSFAGLAMLVALGTYLLWSSLAVDETGSIAGSPNPIAQQPTLFINLLFNTYLSDYGDLVLRGMFGDFASFMYHFPTILVVVQIVVLLITLLYHPSKQSQIAAKDSKLVISMLVAFALSILAITYGLYTAWALKRGIADHADGVQGRYFTALLVLLIPLFTWVSKHVSIRATSEKLVFAIITSTQVILLGFYVLYTLKALAGLG